MSDFDKWWKDQEGYCVPDTLLSQHGIVVNHQGKAAAIGFIIKTDADFCLFEYMVVNPDVRKDERTKCINQLFEAGINKAKDLGFSSMFTFTNNKNLVSRMEKFGFKAADRDVVSLTYNLRGS